MSKETFYTAVDIGSNKVCSIVSRVGTEGELKILGTGVVPSKGMQKGRGVDVAAAVVAAVDVVAVVVVDAVVAMDTGIKAPTSSISSNNGPASAGPLFFH